MLLYYKHLQKVWTDFDEIFGEVGHELGPIDYILVAIPFIFYCPRRLISLSVKDISSRAGHSQSVTLF